MQIFITIFYSKIFRIYPHFPECEAQARTDMYFLQEYSRRSFNFFGDSDKIAFMQINFEYLRNCT